MNLYETCYELGVTKKTMEIMTKKLRKAKCKSAMKNLVILGLVYIFCREEAEQRKALKSKEEECEMLRRDMAALQMEKSENTRKSSDGSFDICCDGKAKIQKSA